MLYLATNETSKEDMALKDFVFQITEATERDPVRALFNADVFYDGEEVIDVKWHTDNQKNKVVEDFLVALKQQEKDMGGTDEVMFFVFESVEFQ